ncbi:SAM-dependent methyltransferase [Catalinimonas alkaloidigena]|uniref:SAM-dependent methyltransferase n=1 Tax=Catalinimonas alkaloidigena TaxID=1075417 RepID=A0A1G9EP42_9BACT|nr:class I SAM-dependent methyltransferase [Catalinimonas alkaloidigena]SDK77874.1 SAM-dependent methyltransferase [Catalinimonas alkaloidigena]
MQYESLKTNLNDLFGTTGFYRKILYFLLDLLLLRSWHIHKEIKLWGRKLRKQSIHILDAGTGFGQNAWYLSRVSDKWSVLAVDVKEDQVCSCNSFFHQSGVDNVFCKTQDLNDLDRPDSFDLELSVDVLTYIQDDVQVLTNMYRALKPGGMLLICSPSRQAGTSTLDGADAMQLDSRIRPGYDKQELREKLCAAGFRKIAMRYIYGRAGRLSWLLSMKYPATLLQRSSAFLWLLIPYYMVVYPFCFVLNWLDMRWNHRSGMGLLVKAWK